MQALEDYIVKKHANAIMDLVSETLERTQAALNADKGADDKATIGKAAERVRNQAEEKCRKGERVRPVRDFAALSDAELDEEEDEAEEGHGARGKPKAKSKAAAAAPKATAGVKSKTTTAAAKKKPEPKAVKARAGAAKQVEVEAPKRTARAAAKVTSLPLLDVVNDVLMCREQKVASYAPEEDEMDVHSGSEQQLSDDEALQESSEEDRRSGPAPRRAAVSRSRGGREVIALDDDEFEEEEDDEEVVQVAKSSKRAPPATKTAKPAVARPSEQRTTGQLFGATDSSNGGAKKRQLPSSFSQSFASNNSQLQPSARKLPPSKNVDLTSGWDD